MEMKICFPGGKKVDADYRGFIIKTDQSRRNGGDGSAPPPFDLFLASIGTCAGVYIHDFCQKRGIDPGGIEIYQNTEKDQDKKRIRKISIRVVVPSDFPQKYKKAMIRAANLCAVKKHILDPPEFTIYTEHRK